MSTHPREFAIGAKLTFILDSDARPADLKVLDRRRLLSNAETGEIVEQSKCVQEPDHHTDDDYRVQDRLDGTRHGDETIDQPEHDTYDDQREYHLYQRHKLISSMYGARFQSTCGMIRASNT